MKKYILFTLSLLCISVISFAQGPPRKISPEMREQFKSYRVAFFSEQLKLTSSEAEKFWPIYNAFAEERETILRSGIKLNPRKIEGKSDAELKQMLADHFTSKQKVLDLEKNLISELEGKLPVAKIVQLPHIERSFKKEMIQKIRSKQ